MFVKNESKIKLALFDLDETLLTFNSMHSFINFFFINYYGERLGLKKIKGFSSNKKMKQSKLSRELLNKLYYKNYEGIDKKTLEELSKQWFEINIKTNIQAFNPPILQRLKEHQQADFKIVLVSGGFFATVDNITNHLNIDVCLVVIPTIVNGILSGDIEGIQTIGAGKAEAILNRFQANTVDWVSSYAYGDHISDLSMLNLVGNPVAVGRNPQLLEIAKEKKWQII